MGSISATMVKPRRAPPWGCAWQMDVAGLEQLFKFGQVRGQLWRSVQEINWRGRANA